MKKLKNSWGSYQDKNMNVTIHTDKIAKALAKNWGDIPKYLSDRRAVEIHCLAKGYLRLQKMLSEVKNEP